MSTPLSLLMVNAFIGTANYKKLYQELGYAQASPTTRILVFYEAAHQAALDKVSARLRIDAALTLPVQEDRLRATLQAWLDAPAPAH